MGIRRRHRSLYCRLVVIVLFFVGCLRHRRCRNQEKAKKITNLIRDKFPKVKTQIQGEAVRVTSGSKDDLQAVMQLIRNQDLDFPLTFNNFR